MRKYVNTIFILVLVLSLGLSACGDEKNAEEPIAPTVWQLSIVQAPDRLDYVEGETFDPTGIVVNAKMSDGTVKENVPCELTVDTPLTRTTLFAEFKYEGKKSSQTISVTIAGNGEEYSVASTPTIADSPLAGKVMYWLGSSVTEGASAGKESMADFIAKKHGAVCIKEAVSGTTLADIKEGSYVERLENYLASGESAEHINAFICQLSTNDKGSPESFGIVTADDVRAPSAFDRSTTFGAMEYIIATVRDTWDCRVYFYTNPPMGDENYDVMVKALWAIANKWDITVIDMYGDSAFNDITAEERSLYMSDKLHPSKAGYREWWLPKFEEALSGI